MKKVKLSGGFHEASVHEKGVLVSAKTQRAMFFSWSEIDELHALKNVEAK